MLNIIILYVLLKHDLTMYSIHKRIEESFGAYTNPSFGAIKPALVRLEKGGFITTTKIMSDGGKLSVFYSITKDGMRELRNLMLSPLSVNPLQFFADARIKLSCMAFLDKADCLEVLNNIKTNALLHKVNAEKILTDEYTPVNFYQKITLDNTICEYKNFISMIDGLEKDNAGSR